MRGGSPAVVQSKPAYAADLAAAREELAALRQNGGERPSDCDAEARLVALPVLPPLAGNDGPR